MKNTVRSKCDNAGSRMSDSSDDVVIRDCFSPDKLYFELMDRPDEELIFRYRLEGATAVLGELYNRYAALIYGVCLKYLKDREEARDATMDIFEKIPELILRHEIRYFRGWVLVTARNHCLMQLRTSGKSYRLNNFPEGIMESADAVHPENDLLEENLTRLEDCLAQLVEAQCRCVRLFYFERKCYAEVARLTGYTDKAVKSHIQNGKRNLKICMEKYARLHP
jgi:RNA polymerase sigma-70 factor (ECF subfamily)